MEKDCNKRQFSKREAVTALKFIRENRYGKKYRKEMRYYHCPLCNNWHLTSREEGLYRSEDINHIIQKEKWMKLLSANEQENKIYEGKSNV
jgi:hypothetical protein